MGRNDPIAKQNPLVFCRPHTLRRVPCLLTPAHHNPSIVSTLILIVHYSCLTLDILASSAQIQIMSIYDYPASSANTVNNGEDQNDPNHQPQQAAAAAQTEAPSPNADDQQWQETFFVRALYDYQGTDASSLSFRRGDVIEVLSRQPSGWWDGWLGGERGWFPANYVRIVSEQEADAELAAREA